MIFRQLFEAETSTFTYLLADPVSREAVLIDPVRETLARDLQLLRELDLRLVASLETHVHADHVTSAAMLREELGSEGVVAWGAEVECADRRVREGDKVRFGAHWLEVLETPGHTDGCVSYLLDDRSMVFTGDALLVRGTGRTDFQQGDPGQLYDSITTKLFTLPGETRVFPGHDYRGHTSSTIAEERQHNPRIGAGRERDQFIEIMAGLELAKPRHIEEAVPANQACGRSMRVPVERSDNGVPEVDGEWVADHRTVRLVDVREPDEWSDGHIDGSQLVPLSELPTQSRGWSREQPVIVLCRSGQRSARAATELEAAGFAHVASLRGGVVGWAKAGRKLVR